MAMETLEFIIYPDGRVQETVTGIIGKSCQEVTAAVEAQLGRVISQSTTADFFSQPLTQVSELNQSTYATDW